MLFSQNYLNIFKFEEVVNKNLRLFDPVKEKELEALALLDSRVGTQDCRLNLIEEKEEHTGRTEKALIFSFP
jgi:hypothetical protein